MHARMHAHTHKETCVLTFTCRHTHTHAQTHTHTHTHTHAHTASLSLLIVMKCFQGRRGNIVMVTAVIDHEHRLIRRATSHSGACEGGVTGRRG